MRIGAHISVAQGYRQAVSYAAEVGCECIQVFAKSPRQWRGPAINPDAAQEFTALRESAGIGPLFTHTAYLLNLSTHDDVLWERSIDALADELARASLLGAEGVVTHIGNDRTADPRRASARVAEAVSRALDRVGAQHCIPRLLLENTAGAGTSVGVSPAELSSIIADCDLPAEHLGICLDTCHAHASGFDLSSSIGWALLLQQIEEELGLDRLGLIHANDSKFESGSRRDRHEWIGDGTIGTGGFAEMVSNAVLRHVSVITEMPGDIPVKDVENLRRLKILRDGRIG